MGKKKKRKKALEQNIASEQDAQAQEQPPDKPDKKDKKKKMKQQPMLAKREHPNWPLVGLASAGMLLTAYLAITSLLGGTPLYCAEGSTCDIVQSSRWGTLMHLPTAFWGFMTYAVLAYIGFRVRSTEWHWKSAWIVSMVGLGYSLYLNTISFFVIEALCAYCLASLSIMAVIFAMVVTQRPKGLVDFKYPTWIGETVVIAVLIIGGLHLHYSGVFDPTAGPEDPYLNGLAEHLAKKEAVFYGAYW
ncbi:MAG TPA: vitamin K epoxide reductase family protein [Nitrospirae bacterium]|nr:vitamin K epoxide reductase family protein [Nitrospirota bacterium]